jgi:SAM-dependent methyltransferase
LLEVVACPACGGSLTGDEALSCAECGASYAIADGIPDLCPPGYDDSGAYAGDPDDQARLRLAWDRTHLLSDPSVQYLIREAVARLPPGGHLLDAGAGTGTIAAVLARLLPAGATLFANDLSRPMLALAQKNLADRENALLFRAEAHAPPYAPDSFDVIVARLTPFGFDRALRALRPGGTYFDVGFGAAHWRELSEVFPTERIVRFGRHYTDDERRAYAREIGFTEVETHGWRWAARHSMAEIPDILDFAPVIEAFDRGRDAPHLDALQQRFGDAEGVLLTHEPRITICRRAR